MTKNMNGEATVNNLNGFIDELSSHKMKEKELVDRFSQLREGMWNIINGDDLKEQKLLLGELE